MDEQVWRFSERNNTVPDLTARWPELAEAGLAASLRWLRSRPKPPPPQEWAAPLLAGMFGGGALVGAGLAGRQPGLAWAGGALLALTGAAVAAAGAVAQTRPPPPHPSQPTQGHPLYPPDRRTGLVAYAPGVWLAQRPLRFMGLPMGARMAVLRLEGDEGGLIVYSPVDLAADIRAAVEALGEVRHIVAPNRLHHLFVEEWAAAWPEARLWAAPGLPERRPDLPWDGVLSSAEHAPWDREEVDLAIIEGSRLLAEVVLFHRASGVLCVADLLQNVGHAPETGSGLLRWGLGLAGMRARPGPPTEWKLLIDDPAEVRRGLEAVRGWPVQRIALAHGRLVEEDADEVLARAFAFLEGA